MKLAHTVNRLPAAPLATILVGLSFWTSASQAALPSGCLPSSRSTQFADVDGDGRADAIVINADGIVVRRSNGNQFLPNQVWSEIPYFGSITPQDPPPHSASADPGATQFADVNGDGMADAIVVNGTHLTVRLSDGQRFLLPNQSWTIDPYFGVRGTFFADVTADGMADAIKLDSTRVGVRASNGPASVFLPQQNWTSGPYYGDYGTYFADVDGDGAADAIAVNHGLGVAVRRAYFISVFPPPQFLPHEIWTPAPLIGSIGVYFADVTGDGMADAIDVDSNDIQVLVSDGQQFVHGGFERRGGPYFGNVGTYFADVTGDGAADAIMVNRTGTGVTVRRWKGSWFGPGEAWTDIPYYGDVQPICIN